MRSIGETMYIALCYDCNGRLIARLEVVQWSMLRVRAPKGTVRMDIALPF